MSKDIGTQQSQMLFQYNIDFHRVCALPNINVVGTTPLTHQSHSDAYARVAKRSGKTAGCFHLVSKRFLPDGVEVFSMDQNFRNLL